MRRSRPLLTLPFRLEVGDGCKIHVLRRQHHVTTVDVIAVLPDQGGDRVIKTFNIGAGDRITFMIGDSHNDVSIWQLNFENYE